MYGKPSPQGSGNGWSGWYKNEYFFRSLKELSFIVNYLDRWKIDWESGETLNIKVEYKLNDTTRNYFPDFIVESKYIVEIKPLKLINCETNKIKFETARKWAEKNGLIFKIIDPKKMLKTSEIRTLRDNNIIKFTERYEKKFLERFNS